MSDQHSYRMDVLDVLEAEAMMVVREAAAQFRKVALAFSGGKDSTVLLHVVRKALWPQAMPWPMLYIETGYSFPEVRSFCDDISQEAGCELIVASVEDAISAGLVEDRGPGVSRNLDQIPVLLAAIQANGFDALLGGARRDEERSRAKERIFSLRDEFGRWDPRRQRPELWSMLNGRARPGEHFRVFPLANWTERDIWHYIARERIAIPSIYFSHERDVLPKDGLLLPVSPWTGGGGPVQRLRVRFRTVGDMMCTAAIESKAGTVDEVLEELSIWRTSERAMTRVDDRTSDSAMEDRKRDGYF